MPRIRRKSANDIYAQADRIYGAIRQQPWSEQSSRRFMRTNRIEERYTDNIANMQGGYIANENQRYTRNQYTGRGNRTVTLANSTRDRLYNISRGSIDG